ncbi:hypothetical protein AWENTII_002192 [Aspergillus wentii]|nr:hypothetical protein MW887_004625 [Aspergillus wentii]
MSTNTSGINTNPRPPIVDTIQLRNIQLSLPAAPDPWHRSAYPQSCTATLKLSYASSEASAETDDVGLTIDYGKLYRSFAKDLGRLGKETDAGALISNGERVVNLDGVRLEDVLRGAMGEDVRLTAGIIANCCLQQLDETALRAAGITSNASPPAVEKDFGRFQIRLAFPKAILRADGGLQYRCVTELGHLESEAKEQSQRRLVVLVEEFRIVQIRSYCILGINPHERLEKQAVFTTLRFQGPGLQEWSTKFIDNYQEMTRVVAERVEATSFGSVEALATLIARIVTMEFGHEEVTVLVQKPSALGFVEGAGLECTRSRAYFEKRS